MTSDVIIHDTDIYRVNDDWYILDNRPKLGEGGNATIHYLKCINDPNKKACIKKFFSDTLNAMQNTPAILTELSNLSPPIMAEIYALVYNSKNQFCGIIMELYDTSLAAYLNKRIPKYIQKQITEQLIILIDTLFAVTICSDLKPENVVINIDIDPVKLKLIDIDDSTCKKQWNSPDNEIIKYIIYFSLFVNSIRLSKHQKMKEYNLICDFPCFLFIFSNNEILYNFLLYLHEIYYEYSHFFRQGFIYLFEDIDGMFKIGDFSKIHAKLDDREKFNQYIIKEKYNFSKLKFNGIILNSSDNKQAFGEMIRTMKEFSDGTRRIIFPRFLSQYIR
jgi:hypothetical protein